VPSDDLVEVGAPCPGMKAVEDVVAEGVVDAETAGQRVAHFNDMLIERLKERLSGP